MTETTFGSSIISKAAQDVRLLVAHVCREGKIVDAGNTTLLLRYADKVKDGLTAEEEGDFWKHYAELVKLAEPARIDSLYFEDYVHSLGPTGFEHSSEILAGIRKHEVTLRRMRIISICAFATTLVFLAYLSITESLSSRNVELGREYQLLSQNTVVGTTIEDTANKILSGSLESKDRGQPAEEGAKKEVRPNLANALGLMSARKSEIEELVKTNDSLLRFFQFGGGGASAARGNGILPYDVVVVSTQKSINSILSNFILPTIAAVLGVTVFLLRTASTRIQDLSFRSNDAGVYWHRLVLGVVGGIAISWFTATDRSGVLSSITPAALAFLIGYSVEVLYNVLDALVKALGGAK